MEKKPSEKIETNQLNIMLPDELLADGVGVGPQKHFYIMDKTLNNCGKYGFKKGFWEPKTHL